MKLVVNHDDPATQRERPVVPRDHRYNVILSGFISKPRASNRMPVKVRNISAGGLMAECPYPARPDEKVEIELPRLGVVTGYIRWGQSGRIGVEFDGPIDPTLAWIKSEPPMPIMRPVNDYKRPGLTSAH